MPTFEGPPQRSMPCDGQLFVASEELLRFEKVILQITINDIVLDDADFEEVPF
jgi:hypothetical protein